MSVNYAIWWFVQPSHLMFFVLLLGTLLLLIGRPRAGRIAVVAAVTGLLLAGFLPLGGWLIAPLENRFPEQSLPAHVDGIIVLAGGEQPAQTARHVFPQFNDYSDRIATGFLLAQRYPTAQLVHSGRTPLWEHGQSGRETTASDVAREFLLSAGLEPGRLILEDTSTNTCESPHEVARAVAPEPDEVWLLVTSALHMPRAMACFRASGFEVVAVPVDFRQAGAFQPLSASLPANLGLLDIAAHEWLGLAYYRLRGKTDELFPAPSRQRL